MLGLREALSLPVYILCTLSHTLICAHVCICDNTTLKTESQPSVKLQSKRAPRRNTIFFDSSIEQLFQLESTSRLISSLKIDTRDNCTNKVTQRAVGSRRY